MYLLTIWRDYQIKPFACHLIANMSVSVLLADLKLVMMSDFPRQCQRILNQEKNILSDLWFTKCQEPVLKGYLIPLCLPQCSLIMLVISWIESSYQRYSTSTDLWLPYARRKENPMETQLASVWSQFTRESEWERERERERTQEREKERERERERERESLVATAYHRVYNTICSHATE